MSGHNEIFQVVFFFANGFRYVHMQDKYIARGYSGVNLRGKFDMLKQISGTENVLSLSL